MESSAYQRILIPTDMSDFGALALHYGALFRERAAAELTLMYADEVYLPVDLLEAPLGYYLQTRPESRVKLQTRFSEFASGQIGGHFETAIVQDTPARGILRTANDLRADLIIMGTHGRHGLRRAILGSVTENVLHASHVPVLTVTPTLMRDQKPEISRIVCPVNFTHVARAALQQACEMAKAFDAELTVMYVIEGIDSSKVEQVETAFSQWVDPQVRDRCRFTHEVIRDGDPAERVLAVAENLDADLIVIGAQHRYFSDATVIGTTTQRITRFARRPVLTVIRQPQREVLMTEEKRELAAV